MPQVKVSLWYKEAKLGNDCTLDTRCPYAQKDGTCDNCDTVDGRWISAVSEYASTCDGPCAELTHHDDLAMDPVTQLGYCRDCIPLLPKEFQDRLERKFEG